MNCSDEEQPLLQSPINSYQSQHYESISHGNELDSNMDGNMGGVDGSRRVLPQYIATLSATTGALAAGCVLGWSSPAENYIVNDHSYSFTVTGEEFSWIGSLATLGGVISCLIIGVVMDMFGRKFTLLLLIIPFTIGWLLIIWPISVVMLYIGRFATGFAGGACFVVLPAYIGEIASKDIRGTLSSCLQLMITVGILFAYVLGHIFLLYTFNVICGTLALIFGAIFVWMPESPYYLIMKNRTDEAEKSLKWLRGNEYNISNELTEIQIEHELLSRNKSTTLNALKKPATKRALMISLILLVLTQFSGINAVIFYTTSIFEKANTGIESSLATIIVGIMQVVATFVASLTVDKLGRRILLVMSASMMCLCNIGLGVYFLLLENNSPSIHEWNWLPICSLCIFIIAFSLGLGPIPWVLVSEIFTTEAKAIAGSLSGSTSWLFAFLVTKFFTNVQELIGGGSTFFCFAGFAIICSLFVIFMVPETKGKTFNEIQKTLQNEAINQTDDNIIMTNASQNTIAI